MTLNEFIENAGDMKPAAVADKAVKALQELIRQIEGDHDFAVLLVENDFFADMVDLEANDSFGTEGMRL